MATKKVLIDEIRIDGGTQVRASINTDVVTEYADRLDELPPAIAFHDGTDYWLGDGFHRYHAHRKAGRSEMNIDVRKGTQRDAILFAVGANAGHGLHRSVADKRKAVKTLLSDKEWGKRSSRWVAETAHVSHQFVNDLRSQVATLPPEKRSQMAELPPEKPVIDQSNSSNGRPAGRRDKPESERIGKDGKQYPVQVFFDDDVAAKAQNNGHEAPKSEHRKPTSATPAKDEAGQTIDDPKLAALYARRCEITELMSAVSRVKSVVKQAVDQKDKLYAHITFSQFAADCNNVYRALRFAKPHAVCPYCGGRGCKVCKSTGLVGETSYKDYTPEDLKV